MSHDALFITGATGLVGHHTLRALQSLEPELHTFALVRDLRRWHAHAAATGLDIARVTPILGDVTKPGLGLPRTARRTLRTRVRRVVHCAADTVFSRPLAEARAVNRDGTTHLVELSEAWPGIERFVQVSTAFVAGRMQGCVPEEAHDHPGFVNGYEQSKHEAEGVVRISDLPWTIVRPSAIVCDGPRGHVTQVNAVHRALRLFHNGLASIMPGDPSNPVDTVSVDYVADCVASLLRSPDVEGCTFHACSGARALRLGPLLDLAYSIWSESPAWRRKAIPSPALTDLATYRLFEQAVDETGDERLRFITRSLSHFVPQLALPKTFETTRMTRVLGAPPPDPATFWPAMLRHLVMGGWGSAVRRAA